ncbi:hypothetical protein NN561_018374 [Cricetulus griseus]
MLSNTEISRKSGLGRCRPFFWLGVAFDAVGVAVLFTGVFADLLFYDMLLYLGSIIIFVSLLWWIFWYTGNIEALPDFARMTLPRAGEMGMHRSGSRRFSLTLRSVSNTFQRIRRRRRRRRLLPRVLQRISIPSSSEISQMEGDSDAGTKGGRTSLHLVKPVSVLNQLQICSMQTSKSMPLVPLHSPLSICTSRSQPLFSATSQCYPLALGTSGSNYQMALSSDSPVPLNHDPQVHAKTRVATRVCPLEPEDSQSHLLVPVPSESFPVVPMTSQSQMQGSESFESYMPVDPDPQRHSKISVASRVYPLDRVDSQSQLLVPVPSEDFPVAPVTSQSQMEGSLAQESQLQNPPASQTQPESDKASESHTLAMEVPVVPPGSAETQDSQASLAQTSQSRSSGLHEVPKISIRGGARGVVFLWKALNWSEVEDLDSARFLLEEDNFSFYSDMALNDIKS